MRNLQPDFIKQQIEALKVLYPELADDEALRVDVIDGETDAIKVIDRLLSAIAEKTGYAKGIALEMQNFVERIARYEHAIKGYKDGIKKIFGAMEVNKLERPLATMYWSKGQPKLLDTIDGKFDLHSHADLPEEFIVTSKELSKTLIRAALLAGEKVPGFTLSNSEPSFNLRNK